MTAGWTAEEIERIGAAGELRITPLDNDAVDAAYRDKHCRYPSHVEPMVRPEAQATTLALVPSGGGRSA